MFSEWDAGSHTWFWILSGVSVRERLEERRQMAVKSRVDYYKKAERFIEKKWKKKYGDDSVDTVLGYK